LGNGAKKAFNSCGEKYRAILVPVIPQAIEALGNEDLKFAEDGANDVANEATYCESEFYGKSPYTNRIMLCMMYHTISCYISDEQTITLVAQI
jgi:hypothetical protein